MTEDEIAHILAPDPPFQFIVDTREQRPWDMPLAIHEALKVGDYSLRGYESVMSIERKSFQDLYTCLTTKLKHLRKQLSALGKLKYGALLIESTATALVYGHPLHPNLSGIDALKRLISLCDQYGVPFHFCDRQGPQFCAILLLGYWKKENASNAIPKVRPAEPNEPNGLSASKPGGPKGAGPKADGGSSPRPTAKGRAKT